MENHEVARTMDTSDFLLLPKTGDLKECKNYQTISLLSHASKVLLIIIVNRLKNKSEMELPDEQVVLGLEEEHATC